MMNHKLDLKLNLSPAKESNAESSNSVSLSSPSSYVSSSSSGTSPPLSCISSEVNLQENRPAGLDAEQNQGQSSPESSSMVLVGCPRCLMYVILSQENDPKCPKCKSTCLLGFQPHTNKKNKNF